MTVKELIEKLQALPQDLDVCIFDYQKNTHYADEDESSIGIYNEFAINEMKGYDVTEDSQEFVALSFANEEYEID